MKKVLFLTRRAHPDIGGVEKHLQHLTPELTKKGLTIETITAKQLLASVKRSRWVKLDIWLGMTKRWSDLLTADIIHIHDVFWWILPIWPLIQHKTYITFHGYEGFNPTKRQIFWHRLAALMTRGNICIGDFHTKWYGVKPDIVSYGAVRPTKNNKKKRDRIVYLGRVSQDNGIKDYVRGFKKFLKNEPGAKLDIYGDGPLKTKLGKLIRTDKKSIKLHGFKANADQELKTANAAFVSRYLSILEALASGTPVIAHTGDEIKQDYLKMTPFADWIQLVSNSDEVSAALAKPKDISTAAKKWVADQTWEKLANDYLHLWGML